MKSAVNAYFAKVRAALPIIAMAGVLVSLVVYGVVGRQGPTHEVHFSYLISLADQKPTEDFQFDGFYALQATDLFSATVASWLTTPEVIARSFEVKGLPLPSEDVSRLQRLVTAEKKAPQLVEVTVRNRDLETSQKLAEGLREVMQQNVSVYHEQTVPALTFRVTTTEPWNGTQTPAATLVATATFLAILILGINAVVLVESFNDGSGAGPMRSHRVT